jgi:hypothetical protein
MKSFALAALVGAAAAQQSAWQQCETSRGQCLMGDCGERRLIAEQVAASASAAAARAWPNTTARRRTRTMRSACLGQVSQVPRRPRSAMIEIVLMLFLASDREANLLSGAHDPAHNDNNDHPHLPTPRLSHNHKADPYTNQHRRLPTSTILGHR